MGLHRCMAPPEASEMSLHRYMASPEASEMSLHRYMASPEASEMGLHRCMTDRKRTLYDERNRLEDGKLNSRGLLSLRFYIATA